MTKTSIIGSRPVSLAEKTFPISFKSVLMEHGQMDSEGLNATHKPNHYKYIELICRDYGYLTDCKFDLMFAYRDPSERDAGVLFLGKWNGGFVA